MDNSIAFDNCRLLNTQNIYDILSINLVQNHNHYGIEVVLVSFSFSILTTEQAPKEWEFMTEAFSLMTYEEKLSFIHKIINFFKTTFNI